MDNLSVINAIIAKREQKKPDGAVHPLITKRLKEREESNAPSKRKTFIRNRYSKSSTDGDGSGTVNEQPDISDGVSGDIEPLL
jgi:hypothetical protein